MLDLSSPKCEATVSDELVRLLSAVGAFGGAEPDTCDASLETSADEVQAEPENSASEVVTEGNEGQCAVESSPEDSFAPWQPIRLRVDGKRPLGFRGILLCERSIRDNEMTECSLLKDSKTSLSLYMSDAGSIIAHVQAIAAEEDKIRPVYRAETVFDSVSLSRFVDSALADFRNMGRVSEILMRHANLQHGSS